MFDWLDEELATIRTRRFHVVDGPADAAFREVILDSPLPAPRSYVDFVLRFGNAKLYRMPKLDLHWMRVYAAPRAVMWHTGEPLVGVGGYDETEAYLRENTLSGDAEAAVYETTDAGLRKVAASFEEWLTKRANRARRRYSRAEWAEVLAGPPPFDAEELAVLEARRLFKWRIAGITPAGDILYEVTNGSPRRLPFLSVGIRGKNGKFRGGVWLNVEHIGPGETAVVAKETYRDLIAPADVEAFALPDPGPEERDRYWEFRGVS